MNYFDLPEVSASDLGALKRLYYGLPDNREHLRDIFDFGSLVDAMLTEKHKLDPSTLGLLQDNGFYIYYTREVWLQAERLARNLAEDPLVARMLPLCRGQYIFRRTLNFNYQGDDFQIRARCKFDLYGKTIGTGLDFKTTACKSQKEFVASIEFLDYDKAAAWYMDLARIDRFLIIAAAKKSDKIFKYVIHRDDETHKRGVEKYSLWAYRWKMLIEPFNLKLAA
jgi:hypothetical protein